MIACVALGALLSTGEQTSWPILAVCRMHPTRGWKAVRHTARTERRGNMESGQHREKNHVKKGLTTTFQDECLSILVHSLFFSQPEHLHQSDNFICQVPRHKLFDTEIPSLYSSSHDDEVDLVPHFCGRLHCTWDGLPSRPPLLRTYPLGNG